MSTTIYVDIEKGKSGQRTAGNRDGRKWSNNRQRSRNDYPGEGTAPLSNEQKAAICIRARDAFERVHGRAPACSSELDAWRRAELFKARGKRSLTTCIQGDYLPLVAHFADLAGESGVAMNAHLRDATSARRVALHRLKTECAERGLTLAWPAAIARNKFKCTIDDCTSKQLWQLIFSVRKSKHKKTPAKLLITRPEQKRKADSKKPTADSGKRKTQPAAEEPF